MPRELKLELDGVEYSLSIEKIDREKLYGRVEVEAFDEKGREAELLVLAADGKTLIGKGGTALETLNEKGDSIDRSELLPIDSDGGPIEEVESSFVRTNKLEPAEIDEYLTHIVRSVYLAVPYEDSDISGLADALSDGRLYKFPFSWSGGVEYDAAFLIGTGNDVFVAVGKQVELQFVKLNQAATLDVDEEEITADDLDFEFL